MVGVFLLCRPLGLCLSGTSQHCLPDWNPGVAGDRHQKGAETLRGKPCCAALPGGASPAAPHPALHTACGVRTCAVLECRVTQVEPLALTTVSVHSAGPHKCPPTLFSVF